MPPSQPSDRAVALLQETRQLLLQCRAVAEELSTATPGAAERIAYGVLVAALEEGLVTTLQHAMDVLRRFSAPAGPLGEQWLNEQERRLRGAPMVPSIWVDETGQRRQIRACLRCGRGEAPVYRFRQEHLRFIGRRLYTLAGVVNWCRHGQGSSGARRGRLVPADSDCRGGDVRLRAPASLPPTFPPGIIARLR